MTALLLAAAFDYFATLTGVLHHRNIWSVTYPTGEAIVPCSEDPESFGAEFRGKFNTRRRVEGTICCTPPRCLVVLR